MGEQPAVQVHVMDDPHAVSLVGAETVVQAVKLAVGRRGVCSVALCGGATPVELYRLLASPAYDRPVPWHAVHLLWGDERCVPPDHPDSNYLLAERSGLLRRRFAGVHRMPGELDPNEGAARYEAELRSLLAAGAGGTGRDSGPGRPTEGHSVPPPDGPGALDLVLLGLGTDGHTASLFPGSPVLEERSRLVAATEERAGHRRLTLTLRALASARRLLFLVSGEGKAQAVTWLLDPTGDRPAARVLQGASRATVLLDRAAAGCLG